MPAIFLTKVSKKEVSPNSSQLSIPQERPISIPSSLWSPKKKTTFLFLFLIFLLFNWWHGTSPYIINVPSKHSDFIGHKKELNFLKERLLKKRSNREINLVAICGEGGIGKTELATAFVNDHLKDFSLICWIDGSSEETVMHSYTALGDILGVKDDHPMRLREKIHWKLENYNRKPWLLIIDDIRHIPNDLPKSGGAVLMTCRDRSVCPTESVVELTKNTEEAVLLLSRLVKEKKSEALEKLAEKLDYLPLMINIAGHYIADTPGIDIDSYSHILASIIETPESPIKSVEFRKRYPRSLEATYLITLKLLEKKHPLSLKFLKQTAFLHLKNIPVEFLSRWLEEENSYRPAQIAILKGDILRELQNHSLIRYDAKGNDFSIHQFLHQTLILQFREDEKVTDALRLLTKLDAISRYNPSVKESIRPFQKILPHCMRVIEQIKDPDLLATRLVLTVARYFVETENHFEKGEAYLRLARQWAEEWDHPVKGRIAFLQGVVQFRRADLQKDRETKRETLLQAMAFFNEARAIFLQQNNDDLYLAIEQNSSLCTKEYQRAISLQYKAQTLRELEQLAEAERIFQQVLEEFQVIAQGKDHFDIARILREQALILQIKGELDASLQKFEEVISMQERVYGNTYLSQPTVGATFRYLGSLFRDRGELAKADKAYQKAIIINQAAYQTDIHSYIAHLYHLRAEVFFLQGETVLAEKLEMKSQEIYELLEKSHF